MGYLSHLSRPMWNWRILYIHRFDLSFMCFTIVRRIWLFAIIYVLQSSSYFILFIWHKKEIMYGWFFFTIDNIFPCMVLSYCCEITHFGCVWSCNYSVRFLLVCYRQESLTNSTSRIFFWLYRSWFLKLCLLNRKHTESSHMSSIFFSIYIFYILVYIVMQGKEKSRFRMLLCTHIFWRSSSIRSF